MCHPEMRRWKLTQTLIIQERTLGDTKLAFFSSTWLFDETEQRSEILVGSLDIYFPSSKDIDTDRLINWAKVHVASKSQVRVKGLFPVLVLSSFPHLAVTSWCVILGVTSESVILR